VEQQAREPGPTSTCSVRCGWTQAAVPIMRAQGSGHIIQVSSIAGVFALPGLGLYHAAKFGLEGFTNSLAAEVKGFGIKVTLVEPAGYAHRTGPDRRPSTPSSYRSTTTSAPPWPARTANGAIPVLPALAVMRVVDADEPPLRIFFGPGPLPVIKNEYAARIAEWEAWDDVVPGGVRGMTVPCV